MQVAVALLAAPMPLLMNDAQLSLLTFVPLSLAVAVVFAATAENSPREIAKRALAIWGKLLVVATLVFVLVMLAQDPWLVAGA